MHRETWDEVIESFKSNYLVLIVCAVLGFATGAAIAILERIEGKLDSATPTPSVRSFTSTKEVEVTVTAKDETYPRSSSPVKPERLDSPYLSRISPRPELRTYPESVRPTRRKEPTRTYYPTPKRSSPKSEPEPEPKPTPTLTVAPSPTQETEEPDVTSQPDDSPNYGG